MLSEDWTNVDLCGSSPHAAKASYHGCGVGGDGPDQIIIPSTLKVFVLVLRVSQNKTVSKWCVNPVIFMVFYLYGTLKIITTLKRLSCLFNIFINLLQAVSISFNWKPAGGVCNEPY